MEAKELKVSAIENGTVIDHIPSDAVFKVISILNLEKHSDLVLFGTNLESKKLGKKGIIKIANKFFATEEIDKIVIIAPTASLTIIKDFKIAEKRSLHIPDKLYNFIRCGNPNCITNIERVNTEFSVISKDPKDIRLKCHYCEKITTRANMKFTVYDI